MDWLEEYVLEYQKDIELATLKLCKMYGLGHLYRDVLAETMLRVVEKANNYNPALSQFHTWAVSQARMVLSRMVAPTKHERYGGSNTNGVHLAYEWMFAESQADILDDSPDDDRARPYVYAPAVYDAYDLDDHPRIRRFVRGLTKSELACVQVLVQSDRFPTYRELGAALGVSHTQAGRILKRVQEKASCLHG